MKSLLLSVPSKTFLAGEYIALAGAPTFVLTTEPRFTLQANDKPSAVNPFHVESPAGKFWIKHKDFFGQYSLTFNDPLNGLGGFGASSAQFVLLHGLYQIRRHLHLESERFFDWHELLKDYRSLHDPSKVIPSGADVVAQGQGGLTYFSRKDGQVQKFAWPFQDIELLCFHTGQKLATHTHLNGFTKTMSSEQARKLESSVRGMQDALSKISWDFFLTSWKEFSIGLEEAGYVGAETLNLLPNLRKDPRVLFARGCGAMGMDVVIVAISKKENVTQFKAECENMNLRYIASSAQISEGLQVRTLQSAQGEAYL